MKEFTRPLDRTTAAEYAGWFKALSDPTRIQIVSLLARRGSPMNVGEIVAAVDVGQSTVSAHLKVLAEVRFVLADHRGTSTYYRINAACVDCFPTAADVVMGRPVPAEPVPARAAKDERRRNLVNADAAAASEPIISRYSALARMAIAGGAIADRDQDAFDDSCFGAAAYRDMAGVTDSALTASLGCGNPVAVAELRPGETVLDLGSGGGLDVLLSARRVGPAGVAYGLDGSKDMLALAVANAAKAGVSNARFVLGRIEDIPLPDEHVDVVISNCVVNLSGDKPRVLRETFRVLRRGGRVGICDVIADDDLDPERRAEAESLIGCASGALTGREYEDLLAAAGFAGVNITVTSDAGVGLHSAIVQAVKPAARR